MGSRAVSWTKFLLLIIYFISFTLWKQDWLTAPAEKQVQKSSTGFTDKRITLIITLVEAPSQFRQNRTFSLLKELFTELFLHNLSINCARHKTSLKIKHYKLTWRAIDPCYQRRQQEENNNSNNELYLPGHKRDLQLQEHCKSILTITITK